MSEEKKFHPHAATSRPRYDPDGAESDERVVVEEPLEIQIAGETLAITMRTPGTDEFLTAGFLFGEGWIRSKSDILELEYTNPTAELAGCNTMGVVLSEGAARLAASKQVKRGTIMTASCGVCGRQTIDDLLEICSPQRVVPAVSSAVLAGATPRLASHQPVFAETGGCHAAAVLDTNGNVLSVHEDVGRHNAVDKAVGELVFDGVIDRSRSVDADGAVPVVLAVSGRVSFEIVQKAAVAGIPVLASVSAASSLAIDLAGEMGVTIAAFARDGRYTLYTHPARVID